LTASSFESVQFSGGSNDRAALYDSAGADVFEATPQWARLSGGGFASYVSGVGSVVAIAGAGGADVARLYDSAGDDSLNAGPTAATLQGSGFSNEARGFSQVAVSANAGGRDAAVLYDSAGADQFDASPTYAWLRGTGYSIRVEGFDQITVVATYGSGDTARLVGSDGNDLLTMWCYVRDLYAGGVEIHTYNFQVVQFEGGGGYDSIDFYANGKNPSLYGRSNYGSIVDQAFETQFSGVESVLANIRANQKLRTDLAALEYAFQKVGKK
jgi:hypothetical protein